MADAGDPKQKHSGTRSRYGPRLTHAEREALATQAVTDRTNALEDPGTAQAFIFLGWIPPLITAVIGGAIVGLRTGSLGALITVSLRLPLPLHSRRVHALNVLVGPCIFAFPASRRAAPPAIFGIHLNRLLRY